MVRKYFLVLVFAVFVTSGTFAIDKSAGLGGNFAANFDSYKYEGNDTRLQRTIGGGFFAFFDITFVEVNVGMLFGRIKQEYAYGEWSDEAVNVSYLTLSLYGKYPFYFDGFSLFPMLGIQYDLGLSSEIYLGSDANGTFTGKYARKKLFWDSSERFDYMNRFWIKLGVGADFKFGYVSHLRPSILYGINLGTNYDRKFKENASFVSSYHHGLDIRLAIGFGR